MDRGPSSTWSSIWLMSGIAMNIKLRKWQLSHFSTAFFISFHSSISAEGPKFKLRNTHARTNWDPKNAKVKTRLFWSPLTHFSWLRLIKDINSPLNSSASGLRTIFPILNPHP